jgi:glutamate-1-semialdehyde 2,1-aminomutase
VTIPFCDADRCPAAGCDPVVCTGAALTNDAVAARSARVIPGGVDSPVRAFRSVGGRPYAVARAEGAHVWDVEGNRFVDLVQSYGAIILGHAHQRVVEAVRTAASDGTSYGAPTPREMKLAEAICARVPSVERVRFVNSGTEATMTAIRLARGATGRPIVVKFAGNYHGHADALLAAGGSGVATLGLSGSAGVTEAAVAQTLVVPYNTVPELGQDVAAVIVEPVAANMGLVPPRPGFLQGLRAACDAAGALLIFDEVITGFRVGVGGAQERLGVRPDLTCFGKVIGGGLPIGAFGGRADVMAQLAPDGPVYQAGTLSGNPLATAAGLAALDVLDADVYETLDARAARLARALTEALEDAGEPVSVALYGPLVGLHFSPTPAVDYDSARTTDTTAYAAFFHAMLRRGVALAPGPYEVAFPGLAHDDAVLDEIASAAAVAAVQASGTSRANAAATR